jgi:hypothetical protein
MQWKQFWLTRQEPTAFRRLHPFRGLPPNFLVSSATVGAWRGWLTLLLTTEDGTRDDSSKVATADQLRLSRMYICGALNLKFGCDLWIHKLDHPIRQRRGTSRWDAMQRSGYRILDPVQVRMSPVDYQLMLINGACTEKKNCSLFGDNETYLPQEALPRQRYDFL